MDRTRILSIDWDYFFPNSAFYDWGHDEKVFFLELIWQLRLNHHNYSNGNEAFTEYTPTIPKNFWKKVIKGTPIAIIIAESHTAITSYPDFDNVSVTNLDAHHDCGYGSTTELNCGNWATNKGIKKYHLYYPLWRKNCRESEPVRTPDSVHYGLPQPAEYDYVFVCRSGCWTPPWYDNKFRSWIKRSGLTIIYIDGYANRNRSLTMKKALELKKQDFEVLKHIAQEKHLCHS